MKEIVKVGHFRLGKTPQIQFDLVSAAGGYDLERDGLNWWYWTTGRLTLRYRAAGEAPLQFRISFTYLPASAGRTLKILLQRGQQSQEILLRMKLDWTRYETPPIAGGDGDIVINFSSPEPPARISSQDPRMMAFAIRNLRISAY